jgi:hypothetical protein
MQLGLGQVLLPSNGQNKSLLTLVELVTQGGRFAGWGFFLEDSKPTYVYNFACWREIRNL